MDMEGKQPSVTEGASPEFYRQG